MNKETLSNTTAAKSVDSIDCLVTTMQVIHTWASSDENNPQSRERAMEDIAKKSGHALQKYYTNKPTTKDATH